MSRTWDWRASVVKPNLTNYNSKSASANRQIYLSYRNPTFFCSISFAFGQSYMTSFPKTGVVKGLYTSSAFKSFNFPLSMKSFPFVPSTTVTFFPRRMNVNVSPYYIEITGMSKKTISTDLDPSLNTSYSCFGKYKWSLFNFQGKPYLLPVLEEELIRMNSICDSASYERHPVEDDRRLVGTFVDSLPQDVEYDG